MLMRRAGQCFALMVVLDPSAYAAWHRQGKRSVKDRPKSAKEDGSQTHTIKQRGKTALNSPERAIVSESSMETTTRTKQGVT